MNIIQQAKLKSKPPPPPPRKPAHLSQPPTTSVTPKRSTDTSTSKPKLLSQKRGIGWPWDFPSSLIPLFTSDTNNSITWLFNWELWVPGSLPPSVQWVPCVRTAAQCKDIIPFLTDIITNQGRSVTHFLGFNEPEIPSQANMTVDEAVALWKDYVLPAKKKFTFRLGSPGMSSDVGLSVKWLDEFLGALGGVEGAGVDFMVVHWYGFEFREMRSFLEMIHERYSLPVWVNEFGCSRMGGEVKDKEVEVFLKEAVPWLDGCPWVEKYAYFGNGQGLDVGDWVGKANNFTEVADKSVETNGRRLSRIGKLYLDL